MPRSHNAVREIQRLVEVQIEVVELVAVLHDIALDLGRVDPGDKIFHVPAPC
jgi:hypothetical protein